MILKSLDRTRYRSKIALSDAYFLTRVEPMVINKKNFKSPFGCLVSKVMLQEDMNATGTFMRIMSDQFAHYLKKFSWVHIHYMLIYSDIEEEHLEYMAIVCEKLKKAQLEACRTISKFFASSMDVMGHVIDRERLKASPEKIVRIEAWTTPRNKRQL